MCWSRFHGLLSLQRLRLFCTFLSRRRKFGALAYNVLLTSEKQWQPVWFFVRSSCSVWKTNDVWLFDTINNLAKRERGVPTTHFSNFDFNTVNVFFAYQQQLNLNPYLHFRQQLRLDNFIEKCPYFSVQIICCAKVANDHPFLYNLRYVHFLSYTFKSNIDCQFPFSLEFVDGIGIVTSSYETVKKFLLNRPSSKISCFLNTLDP